MNNGNDKRKKDAAAVAEQSIYEELGKLAHDIKIKLLLTSGHSIEGNFLSISHQGVIHVLNPETEQIISTHTHFICAMQVTKV